MSETLNIQDIPKDHPVWNEIKKVEGIVGNERIIFDWESGVIIAILTTTTRKGE